jgi:hypothetical protein
MESRLVGCVVMVDPDQFHNREEIGEVNTL